MSQLEMFHPQPRDANPDYDMPESVWSAILTLRKAGYTVYRRRSLHAVNGAQVTTHQLLKMAEECRKSQQSRPTSSST